jgi:hypothetical protein
LPEAIAFQEERALITILQSKCSTSFFYFVIADMYNLKILSALTIVLCFVSTSCIRRAYYYSPLQGNSFTYHAIPVGSDSVKSATYVFGALSLGGMNEDLRDNVYTFQAGIHRSHTVDNFRFYYGASIAYGSYNVKSYTNYYYDSYYLDTTSINRNAGGKYFGAYGLNAGISASAPMGRRGEWRYFGIEGSLFNEFGDYYSFRKNLPDSAATIIDKKKYIGSVGINTELVFKGRSLNKFGIKIAMGSYLRRLHYYNGYSANFYNSSQDLFYFTNTYHFTIKKATTYFQFTLATKAGHFQFGVNYRL